jgi:hypothetical protein
LPWLPLLLSFFFLDEAFLDFFSVVVVVVVVLASLLQLHFCGYQFFRSVFLFCFRQIPEREIDTHTHRHTQSRTYRVGRLCVFFCWCWIFEALVVFWVREFGEGFFFMCLLLWLWRFVVFGTWD